MVLFGYLNSRSLSSPPHSLLSSITSVVKLQNWKPVTKIFGLAFWLRQILNYIARLINQSLLIVLFKTEQILACHFYKAQ